MIVINFLGGPGAGKSTKSAKLYAKLKELGLETELLTEFAKQLTWTQRFKELSDQIYVFAHQQHQISSMRGIIDYAVVDGSVLHNIFYKGPELVGTSFDRLVLETYYRDINLNLLVKREFGYNTNGRKEDEALSLEIDSKIRSFLEEHKMHYIEVDASDFEGNMERVLDQITALRQLLLTTSGPLPLT